MFHVEGQTNMTDLTVAFLRFCKRTYNCHSITDPRVLRIDDEGSTIPRQVATHIQGGSNMTGTNCDLFTHK